MNEYRRKQRKITAQQNNDGTWHLENEFGMVATMEDEEFREKYEPVPDTLRSEIEKLRALMERVITDCEYATETFRKEIVEALK